MVGVTVEGGRITNSDIYRQQLAMDTDLRALAVKLAVLDVRNQGADTLHADHEARLRVLERFRLVWLGAATATSVVVSTSVQYLLTRR